MTLANTMRATLATFCLATATITSPVLADVQTAPNHNSSITDGKFTLLNNEWGLAYNGWGGGSETISADPYDSNHAWSLDFSWYNVQQWDEYHIKTYPAIIDGWQYGYSNPATDLPIILWDNKNVYTNWSFNYNANNWKYDIAYDLWLDTNPNPSGQPQDEIMIWLDYAGSEADEGLGSDAYVETVNIGGADWRVYHTVGDWEITYFVRAQKTQSSNLNLQDFFSYLEWGKGWLSNNQYLLSIEAGTEIWYGNGTLNTTSYNVSIG